MRSKEEIEKNNRRTSLCSGKETEAIHLKETLHAGHRYYSENRTLIAGQSTTLHMRCVVALLLMGYADDLGFVVTGTRTTKLLK